MAEIKARIPPHSLLAEQTVLGSVLLDRDAVVAVVEFLRPEHFYEEKHQHIFEAVIDLYQEREPIDVVSVSERLKKKKTATEINSNYLAELVNMVPTAGHAEHYGRLVRDNYTKRQMITAAAKISDMAFDDSGDVRQILDTAESTVFSLSQQHLRQVFVPVKEILAESFDRLDELHKTSGSLRGVPTGFVDLDETLAGMQNSNLIILAARPGVGKCVTGDTLVIDPITGRREKIKDLVDSKEANVVSLNQENKLNIATPTRYVDDGNKQVFEVTTALGNRLEATAVHPLLTIGGWKRVEELGSGDRIAVPRRLDYFGSGKWPDYKIVVLAYLLGDGNLTNASPRFTNSEKIYLDDFCSEVSKFGGVITKNEKQGTIHKRTPTVIVKGVDIFHKEWRKKFSEKLKMYLDTMCLSQRQLALNIGVSPALVCLWVNEGAMPGSDTRLKLSNYWQDEVGEIGINPVTEWLRDLGVMGKGALEKELPAEVFGLCRENLAKLLNRLYSCEGSVVIGKNNGIRISFASSSSAMAEQIKHLLLRFGILSRLRRKRVKYRGGDKIAFEVEILGSRDMICFANEIGIFGKEKKLKKLTEIAKERSSLNNFTKDTLPMGTWDIVKQEMGNLSFGEINRRMGKPASYNIHYLRRQPRRETIRKIGKAINSKRLINLAESDLYWDRIVAIKSTGVKRVYDLTIDRDHNFIANDIVVHNTAFALNIAQNAAFKYKLPVGFFSLEMSREELMDRILVAQAEIDAWKMKTGRLDEDEFSRLSDAMGELYDTPLYIDDTPGMSILEMRTKARRLQAEHGLSLVIVDYLQLARPVRSLDNRVQEVSEVSQGLKNLARELKVPVVALSQLSRQVESRGIKKPQLADLRESGAIEQDADVVMFMWRENDEDLENMNLDIAKHRNGPLRSIKLRFKGDRIKFYSMEGKRKEEK